MDPLDAFLDWHRALGHSPHTIASYGATVRALRRALPEPLAAPRAEVRAAVRGLLTGAASSRNQRLAAIKSFYSWAVEEELRVDDPVAGLRAAKLPATLPKALDDRTVAAVLRARDDSPQERRDAAIVAVLYASGLRLAELCALDVADLDRAGIRVVGKGDKERVVFLNPAAWDAVGRWLGVRDGYNPRDGALFLRRGGVRIGPDAVQRLVARRGGKRTHVHPHQFRHTYATRLGGRAGGNPEHVRRLLGHASGVTTQRYIDVRATDLRATYDAAMAD